MKTPQAKQVPYTLQIHGETLSDPYAWLRYRDQDPDVIAYLEEENAYAKNYLQDTEKTQTLLFNEMCARMQLEDMSVPYFEKGYFYYWRTTETSEYPTLCRRKGEMSAPEEIILDENALAKDHTYFHIGDQAISHDQRYLAYTEDKMGNEEYELFIKDLSNNTTINTGIKLISAHIVWANDNATLFFIKLDETWRPYQVWTYNRITEVTRLCYTETDPAFWVHVSACKTEKFIFINVGSKITTETHFVSADTPDADFSCLYPRQENVKYDVIPHENCWYIHTNLDAKNYKLMKVSIENPASKNWEMVLAHRPDVKIEDVEIFKNFLVVGERHNANVQLRVLSLTDEQDYILPFAENAYTVTPTDNIDFYSDTIRIAYASLTTPRTIYDIHMPTQERQLLKQTPVLGGFLPEHYHSERLYATAEDGTAIPISLVYHQNTPLDGSAPLYLYGYGSYGICLDPWFSHARLSLLNRGIIFAIAHVRGGGDNGEYWYEAGKFLCKKNTFTDFIACAQHLIHLNYSSSSKLIISGGSAGGLLMGAVLNMQPQLFGIAIADVPFVDALNTMLDPTIPLTTAEYVEWGNPADNKYYQYIKSYSPYDNITKQDYPAILVTAGLSDPRVQYWEPAKWVAKLRAYKTDHNPLLLNTNMAAGHGGASGRFSALKEVAFEYAFILKELEQIK
jgi:oligopeptidase B